MFIGREPELKFLNDKYEAEGGQFVILDLAKMLGCSVEDLLNEQAG